MLINYEGGKYHEKNKWDIYAIEESKTISAFVNLIIIDLILKHGVDALENLPSNIRKNKRKKGI